MNKSDLSKLIAAAVRWRVLEQTVEEARDKFADLSPDALDALIEEAITAVRRDAKPAPPTAR